MDLLRQDSAALAARVEVPMLIVQGGKDIQVSRADADALHAANSKSELVVAPNMNHVLKDVSGDDRASNLAVYADPSLPVDTAIVDAIASFVKR
jgi:fermentation-respiration switch protein FrsA (DUF1100 family)